MSDGMFGAISGGAASGAGQGATVGSIIPGIGTAVGAGVGALVGGIGAGIKQSKANNSQNIPLVDPIERSRLASLEQLRKSISSGTDASTKQGIEEQENIGRSTQGAIVKSTGGDVGSTIDALLKAKKSTQGGVNQLVTANQGRLPYFDSMVSQMGSKIAQRKLELGLLNRSQAVAENAQARTDNNLNANAYLGTQFGTQTIPEGIGQGLQQIRPTMQSLKDLISPPPTMKPLPVRPLGNIGTPEIVPSSGIIPSQPVPNMPVNQLPLRGIDRLAQPQIIPQMM